MQLLAKIVAATVPPLLALGGCSVLPGSGLTPLEARTALYEALDDTQDALGGSWENNDDPTARGCVIPLWVEGQMYPGLRIGEPPVRVQWAIDTVTDAWSDWDYRVEQTLVGDVTELQGRNALGELVIFKVSATAMTLQGESECRPDAG